MDSIDSRDIVSHSASLEDDPLSFSHAPRLPSDFADGRESVYKTKAVQFLGRTTPIVLQNDNGPCPLLAICNVLLLRNNLNLSPDVAEVSQERLLSLVAERLIDSNCNLQDKDAGYIENQQQNVADAIDLLPRLATGIDVNIKFRRIDDFEFTRECAIFDLLDIPLYHGWIVDPQDQETSSAIGSKSYNALTGELVALESKSVVGISAPNKEDDSVDFAAATTATLGVPSPSLIKMKSFDADPCSPSTKITENMDNDPEFLKTLKLTDESSHPMNDSFQSSENSPSNPGILYDLTCSWPSAQDKTSDQYPTSEQYYDMSNNAKSSNSSLIDTGLNSDGNKSTVFDLGENLDLSEVNKNMIELLDAEGVASSSTEPILCSSIEKSLVDINASDASSTSLANHAASPRSVGERSTEDLSLSVDGSEPLYEGEECIIEAATTVQQEGEPIYEGENILAEQADTFGSTTPPITHHQGELIRNFLNKHANQLTFYGLFCLQEGLKERELCVFFRNNHLNTMFKFDGQLYLLATDQGYINQPNLVWEKLTEVNGDTLYMTSNFKEFKISDDPNEPWDERNVMTSTADYLASIDQRSGIDTGMSSDLQLAIALQQQEFDQRTPRSSSQPSSAVDSARLITGPQRPTNAGRISKPEPKLKDKCTLM